MVVNCCSGVARREASAPAPMAFLLLALLLGVVAPWTAPISAQENGAGDPRSARFALLVENRTNDPAVDLLLDAARSAITDRNDAFWFLLEGRDFTGARDVQAEMLAVLSAEGESPQVLVSLKFHRLDHRSTSLPAEPEVTAEVSTLVDRAGRYQRRETWALLVEAVDRLVEAARPVATVTLRGRIPFTLEGVPRWVVAHGSISASPASPALPAQEHQMPLRTLRNYSLTAAAPGYRSQDISFYLHHDPLVIPVNLRKYPRHTVAFVMRGVAWPGVEYQWYDSRTRWTVHGSITSFALGFTGLRQLGDLIPGRGRTEPEGQNERDPRLFGSLPLTEVEVGGGRLLGHRDSIARWQLTGSLVARITHGSAGWGLEPVMPVALRAAVGRERELGQRFFLTQRIATEWYWPVQEDFLRQIPWGYHLGPVVWQLPVYRLGVRMVL